MWEIFYKWSQQDKVRSRISIFIFLLLIFFADLISPNNIKSMVTVLRGTEVIGFLLDRSFIKVFIFGIPIIIILQYLQSLRDGKKIFNNLINLQSEMNKIDYSDRAENIKKFTKEFTEYDLEVLDKVVINLLNILILLLLEGIFVVVLSGYPAATSYILITYAPIPITYILLYITHRSTFQKLTAIENEIESWKESNSSKIEEYKLYIITVKDNEK